MLVFGPISFQAGLISSDFDIYCPCKKENRESEQITGLLRLCKSLSEEKLLKQRGPLSCSMSKLCVLLHLSVLEVSRIRNL